MRSGAMTMDSTHSRDIFRASGFKKCGESGKNYASTEEQITGSRSGKEKKKDKVGGGRRGEDENTRSVTQMERQSFVETAPSANQQKAFLSAASECMTYFFFTSSLATSIAAGTIAFYLPIFPSSFAFLPCLELLAASLLPSRMISAWKIKGKISRSQRARWKQISTNFFRPNDPTIKHARVYLMLLNPMVLSTGSFSG